MLTTLDKVKIHLGITGESQDVLLEQLILQADQVARSFCKGRNFERETYTNEYADGTGARSLFLRNRPIVSVSDLRVDESGYAGTGQGAFNSDSAWEEGEDFFVKRVTQDETNRSELVAIGKCWPLGDANIRVSYVAGYVEATLPRDIEFAVNMIVAQMRAWKNQGMQLSAEQIGSYSYQIMSAADRTKSALLVDAAAILANYKPIVI